MAVQEADVALTTAIMATTTGASMISAISLTVMGVGAVLALASLACLIAYMVSRNGWWKL